MEGIIIYYVYEIAIYCCNFLPGTLGPPCARVKERSWVGSLAGLQNNAVPRDVVDVVYNVLADAEAQGNGRSWSGAQCELCMRMCGTKVTEHRTIDRQTVSQAYRIRQ